MRVIYCFKKAAGWSAIRSEALQKMPEIDAIAQTGGIGIREQLRLPSKGTDQKPAALEQKLL